MECHCKRVMSTQRMSRVGSALLADKSMPFMWVRGGVAKKVF